MANPGNDSLTRRGILAQMDDDDLQALMRCATRIAFKSGDAILQEGQHNDSLFIVQEGLLHVRRSAQKRAVALGRLEAGSCFGEVSLFDPGLTTASVHAVSDGAVLRIGRDELQRFTQQQAEGAVRLLSAILGEMSRRLRHVDEQLIDSILWGALLK